MVNRVKIYGNTEISDLFVLVSRSGNFKQDVCSTIQEVRRYIKEVHSNYIEEKNNIMQEVHSYFQEIRSIMQEVHSYIQEVSSIMQEVEVDVFQEVRSFI